MISAIKRERLSTSQALIFKEVINEASADPFLYSGNEEQLLGDRQCWVVLENNVPVGFYSPKRQSYLGVNHWRAGTLFLRRQARGKGIMRAALKDFFTSHNPGLSWIVDTNSASINLFTSLGFKKDKAKIASWGEAGHWYIKKKMVLQAESLDDLPVYLRW